MRMTEPPSHPETRTGVSTEDSGEPVTRAARWKMITVWGIGIALLLVMLILHLTGIFGPGMNG